MDICKDHEECNNNGFLEPTKNALDVERREPQSLSKDEIETSFPKRLIRLGDGLKPAWLVPYPDEIIPYAALSYWYA